MAKPRHCARCGAELPRDTTESTCARCVRTDSNLPEFLPMDQLHAPRPTWDVEPPPFGIHVAANPTGPGRDQFCARCGALLATERVPRLHPMPPEGTVPPRCYPLGALVERGRGWQAMLLRPGAEPTCTPQTPEPAGEALIVGRS